MVACVGVAALAAAVAGCEENSGSNAGGGQGGAGPTGGGLDLAGTAQNVRGAVRGVESGINQQQQRTLDAANEAIGGLGGQGGEITAAGLAWSVPAGLGWERVEGVRPPRAAELRFGPGREGEIVFFAFGPGQGGDAASNINRWASQVLGPQGLPAEPVISERDVGGVRVTIAQLRGTYQSGSPGQAPVPKPGYVLIGAVVEGPGQTAFVRFTAPEAMAPEHGEAFKRMVQTVRAR
ncbi:MAG: hypothetical protein C0475_06090 [Planctomyces sp.]|nr:hypothetical protein [Planctomyces sp.]